MRERLTHVVAASQQPEGQDGLLREVLLRVDEDTKEQYAQHATDPDFWSCPRPELIRFKRKRNKNSAQLEHLRQKRCL